MVCGTAGAGKSHFAAMLCRAIPNSTCIEVNDIVEKLHLYSKRDRHGTKIVEPSILRKEIMKETKGLTGLIVVVGHLAAETNIGADVTVVVRAHLKDIESRLKARKYPLDKIAENIISEAVDYSGEAASIISKEAYEVRSDRSKRSIIHYIFEKMKGSSPKPPDLPQIKSMRELLRMIKSGNKYNL